MIAKRLGAWMAPAAVAALLTWACEKGATTPAPDDTHLLVVTHPEGGETFHVGDTVTIAWRSPHPENIDAVDIELSPDDGSTWGFYVNDHSLLVTDADWGTYRWVVGDSVTTGSRTTVLPGNSHLRLRVERGWSVDSGTIGFMKRSFTVLPKP